jgi:hypothetical protein
VTDDQWFTDDLRAEISQGDIYSGIPFSAPAFPITHLKKETISGKRTAWMPGKPPDKQSESSPNFALFAYRLGHGIIISHNCAIDKPHSHARILMAAVRDVSVLDARAQQSLREQRTRALLLLPGLKGVGDCFADLRTVTPIPREIVDQCPRTASLTDAAVLRLTTHLVTYLTDLVPG